MRTTIEEWGEEWAEQLFDALAEPSPTALRYHPLKECERLDGEAVPWSGRGIYLDERPSFTLDPLFHAGCYYVQEASSQFMEKLLEGESREGLRLLDMCAAPGGKTTLYSSILGGDGLVVANEVDRRRVQILMDNVRKWGMGNVVVTSSDASKFEALEGWFDVVAVDAPCSGEGMFRRLPLSLEEWSPKGVAQCSALQREIVRSAWRALKPGGLMIYSTCTYNKTEDEGAVESLLEFIDGDCCKVKPVVDAEKWGVVMGEVGEFTTYRFFPHKAKGEGLFVAVVRKGDGSSAGRLKLGKERLPITPVDKRELGELQRWINPSSECSFYRAGETIYGCRLSQLDNIKLLSQKVSVLYSGVAMGEIFKGKLKPDWALAMFVALNREALPMVSLDLDGALGYLRKADVEVEEFKEGLNLVEYKGHPLGFAKRIGARVNNMYPNSLRIVNK